VRYHGYALRVPASWPVYDLARKPQTCVRFNRRAVYLGIPGSQQLCPAHAAGSRGAILVEPAGRAVRVIRSVQQTRAGSGHAPRAQTAAAPRARAAAPRAHAASVYTGLGFEGCEAPSTQTMSAWSSSPYRAIGVYIGGANAACLGGNLTPSWVATELAAGWHLIPTYVGLQAPSNSCGCSGMSENTSTASGQGTAAADDAVGEAQALGIPAGNPVYYDMESYPTGGANSSAVLAFLAAWTNELHAKGYVSGIYSSASTGISDLSARYNTGYVEPDDLWIADWNGVKSTSDPYVPASYWSNHRRLHQYSGGHDETYGGVTLNIDSDYLDGATVGAGASAPPPPPKPPNVSISAASNGTTSVSASWSGQGLASWRVLAGVNPSSLSSVGGGRAHGSRAVFKLPNGSAYFAVQALGSAGQALATSPALQAPAHLAVFGHSAFVSRAGTGGIPAGCYTRRPCHTATTIRSGGVTVATTGSESIPSGSTGIVYFTLTSTGRFMLANARGGRLPVQAALRDVSGSTATVPLNLIGFSSSGAIPARHVTQSPPVGILGTTDFVPARGLAGILASCSSPAPCHLGATISAGRTVIAKTGTEAIGAEEAGYVFFSLSRRGRLLLAQAPGNHLPVTVTLAAGSRVARGTIVLVGFS